MDIRIGYGWDSHAFKAGVPLKIGGLSIEHPEGLAGHSDGDVSAGDIGSFFPPGDPRWKDADSAIFLGLAIEEIQNAGYRIVNVDTTLVLNAPKIGPISSEMRERVADLLGIAPENVGIKAKTPEGMAADHVAQAHAVVLLEHIEEPEEVQMMSAVIQSQRELEDVVRDLVSQVHGVPVRAPFDTEDIT
jgi:2-C-methyl-D-erythritol 2,4-cyclodiphosphate synthase